MNFIIYPISRELAPWAEKSGYKAHPDPADARFSHVRLWQMELADFAHAERTERKRRMEELEERHRQIWIKHGGIEK